MKKTALEGSETELGADQPTDKIGQENIEDNTEREIEKELLELGENISRVREGLTDNLRLQTSAINEGLSIKDIELAQQAESAFRDIVAAKAELKVDAIEDFRDVGTKVLTSAERMRQSGLEQEDALKDVDFTVVDLATLRDIDASINAQSRLVLVGINEYQNPNISLRGSINDIDAIKKSIISRYGVTEDQVVVITDQNATKEGILSTISQTAQELAEGQSLLVYYSGHGVRQGKESVIAPHDFQSSVEDASEGRDIIAKKSQSEVSSPDIDTRGISSDELIGVLGGKSSVVITDMCWGGGFHRGLAKADNLTTISSTDYQQAHETVAQTRDVIARKKEVTVSNKQGDIIIRGFWSARFTDAIDQFDRGIGTAAEIAGSIAKETHNQKTLFNRRGKRYKQGILNQ